MCYTRFVKRNEVIQVRVSPEEKAEILARAKTEGINISAAVRKALGSTAADGSPATADTADVSAAKALEARVRQLVNAKTSPQRAERQARRELGP